MAIQKIKNIKLARLELALINKNIKDLQIAQEDVLPSKKESLELDTYQTIIMQEESE